MSAPHYVCLASRCPCSSGPDDCGCRPSLVQPFGVVPEVVCCTSCGTNCHRTCMGCGCTWSHACPGGCSWVREDAAFCSVCIASGKHGTADHGVWAEIPGTPPGWLLEDDRNEPWRGPAVAAQQLALRLNTSDGPAGCRYEARPLP